MPKRAITGWRKIAKGKNVRYENLKTGENVSYRQYVKQVDKVKSLEAKAKKLKLWRQEKGIKEPMSRYNAVVLQWKATHDNADVKGDSKEAKEFRKLYEDLKKSRAGKKGEKRRLRVLHELGVISDAQYERYA